MAILLPAVPASASVRIEIGTPAIIGSLGSSPVSPRYRRSPPPTTVSSTSLTVAPATAARTRLASARSITIASPTRFVVTRWLRRVGGGRFGARRSRPRRRASWSTGRSAGTERVRKRAARSGACAALAAVIASSASGAGVGSGCHVSTTGSPTAGVEVVEGVHQLDPGDAVDRAVVDLDQHGEAARRVAARRRRCRRSGRAPTADGADRAGPSAGWRRGPTAPASPAAPASVTWRTW